ncbi:transposase for IS2404, partial [mine drainage metagenome]
FFPPPAIQVEKAHGRIETRVVQTSTALNDYLDFPYVGQVFRIKRATTLVKSGKQRHEVAYGVTSCPPPGRTPAGSGSWRVITWGVRTSCTGSAT